MLVHLDRNVDDENGDDKDGVDEDDEDGVDEDDHRPREIVPARDVPPVPLLGQLVVLHCFGWCRTPDSGGAATD